MDVILVRKKTAKSSHTQLAKSILVPVSFLSMLTVGASEVDFQYEKPPYNRATSTTPPHPVVAFEESELANHTALTTDNIEDFALRISALPNQTERLDKKGKTQKFDFSLSWDNIITKQQSTIQSLPEAKPLSHSASWQFSHFSNAQEVKHSIKIVSKNLLQKYRARTQILPAGWPLKQGRVSSGFGRRGRRMHKGIDIAAEKGTPIEAVEDGIVVCSKYMRGYGRIVEIKHSDMYTTRYAHNSKNLVKVGEQVDKGQVIALVGSTGRSTGHHVHFEVLQSDLAINPLKYLGAMDSFTLSQNIKLSEYVKLSRK